MDDTLLTVLIVGAVVAFFVFRARRRPAINPVSQVNSASAPPPPPPARLSEEERLAQEAAKVQSHWDEERRAVEEAHNDEMRPIMEKLENALQLVHKSGVGDAACDILRIMWHWPSWSKRDDWNMPVPIEGLDGGTTPKHQHSGREGTWLGWKCEGKPFRLELSVNPNYTQDDFETGHLQLTVGEELVMHLDVSQRSGDEYYTWRAFGVSAFKAGPWMAKLNELAGSLRIADQQWSRDHERTFYGQKARNIELE